MVSTAEEKLGQIAPLTYLEVCRSRFIVPLVRLIKPLHLLQQWPFPAFVFSTVELHPEGSNSPLPSPTTPTLGTVRHRQRHPEIPLVWANEKWKSFSHNRPLRSLLDNDDVKVLNVWLRDEYQSAPTLTVTIQLAESVQKKLDLVRVPINPSKSNSKRTKGNMVSTDSETTIIVHAIERAPVQSFTAGSVPSRSATPRTQSDYFMGSDPNTPEAIDLSEMISPMTEVEREPFMLSEQDGESPKGWNDQFVGDRTSVVSARFFPSMVGRCLIPSFSVTEIEHSYERLSKWKQRLC